jgi:hypothetical protein
MVAVYSILIDNSLAIYAMNPPCGLDTEYNIFCSQHRNTNHYVTRAKTRRTNARTLTIEFFESYTAEEFRATSDERETVELSHQISKGIEQDLETLWFRREIPNPVSSASADCGCAPAFSLGHV